MTLSNEIWVWRDDVKQWDITFKRWRQGMTEGMMEKVARNDVRNVWRDDQKIKGMTLRNDHFFVKDCDEMLTLGWMFRLTVNSWKVQSFFTNQNTVRMRKKL